MLDGPGGFRPLYDSVQRGWGRGGGGRAEATENSFTHVDAIGQWSD